MILCAMRSTTLFLSRASTHVGSALASFFHRLLGGAECYEVEYTMLYRMLILWKTFTTRPGATPPGHLKRNIMFVYTADDKPHEVQGQGTVTLLLHNGAESLIVRLHALHVPSLGHTLVSLGCIKKRGKVTFQLSKDGTPTLTQHDRPWAAVVATRNGLLLLSGHIVFRWEWRVVMLPRMAMHFL